MSKNFLKKIKNKTNKSNEVIISIVGILVFAIVFWLIGSVIQKNTSIKDEALGDKINQRNIDHSENTSWEDFISTDSGFKASFPSYPTHKIVPIVSPNLNPPGFNRSTEMYTAKSSDGIIYAVNISDFSDCPYKTDGPEEESFMKEFFLEAFIQEVLIDPDGELVSSNLSTFGSDKAIDFLIYKKGTDTYTKGKNILSGKKLYQILTTYESVDSSKVEFDKFVASFQL